MSIAITNLERSLLFRRFMNVFDEPQAEVLADTIGLIAAQIRGEFATREDIQDLKGSIQELAEAQRRTEERVEELAEAQRRTEERVEELAEAQRRTEERVEELAGAQARTEERVSRLEEALARLAEAQSRTDEAVKALAEAQRRTEERVEELAEAQRRTDEAVKALAEAQARTERKVDRLAKQVGGLSETVGGDIEDIAYIVLHRVLGQKKGWKVGELKRTWHRWNGRQVEVNIFGEAHDPAQPDRRIWIVGEAKHNLTMREVEKFARVVRLARQNLEGEIYPVCFCYRARPEVQERIRALGFHTVFSYGELVESEPGGDEA